MEEKRIMPYGVINWATLVRECLFVDNTACIRNLEKVPTPVFLLPKRFDFSTIQVGTLAENRLPPLYVIIDEYDNFANELVVSGRDIEYNAVCGHDAKGDATRESFLKAFFKSFKAGLADGTVGRTYFTGVLPIAVAVVEVCGNTGYNWFDLPME